MVCSRPTAPRYSLRSGVTRCGNPGARVRDDVPGTRGQLVVLCDPCALAARVRYRVARKRLRALVAVLVVAVVALLGCTTQQRLQVVDAHDLRCVVIHDEHGAGYCVTEQELRTLLPLLLADRRAHLNDLAAPGF